MRRVSPLVRLFIILGAFAGSSSVSAQSYYQPIDFSPPNTQLWSVDTVSGQDSAEDAVEARAKQQGFDITKNSQVQLVEKLNALTRYNPSSTLRQSNANNFIARVKELDPAGGAGLEDQFRDGTIFGAIDQAMKASGYRTNNVADAFALWWISAWEASQGIIKNGDDPETVAAVRKQAMLALLSSNNFKTMSDAKKQEMADEYVMQTVIISSSLSYIEEHKDEMPRFRKTITEVTRKAGMDLNSMQLTKQGFVEKGRKTGDASSSSADIQLADKEDGLSASQLAMIAAAGGAGLGLAYFIGKASARKG